MKKTIYALSILMIMLFLIGGCTQKTVMKASGGNKDRVVDSNRPIQGAVSPPDDTVSHSNDGSTPAQNLEPITPREQQECEVDSDCVPIPTCHPRACINKEFESAYRKPSMCTEMFDCSAAYNATDCTCVGTKCTNINLGNKGCPDIPQ